MIYWGYSSTRLFCYCQLYYEGRLLIFRLVSERNADKEWQVVDVDWKIL